MSQRPVAPGYAFINHKNQIDVRTVSPTKRAAMVNWLAVHSPVIPRASWTDDKIAEEFERLATRTGLGRVAEVVVEEAA